MAEVDIFTEYTTAGRRTLKNTGRRAGTDTDRTKTKKKLERFAVRKNKNKTKKSRLMKRSVHTRGHWQQRKRENKTNRLTYRYSHRQTHRRWVRQPKQAERQRKTKSNEQARSELCEVRKQRRQRNWEWMKIYQWRLTISTQNNGCSQRQVPQQAKKYNNIRTAQPTKTHSKNPDRKQRHT